MLTEESYHDFLAYVAGLEHHYAELFDEAVALREENKELEKRAIEAEKQLEDIKRECL